ncbi:WD40 repeat-containing protein [Cynara cardunculus var. scolymus]|uniref:Serine-threonine kinase receptor-associated protein n=1 Tax=Cynara cardunculus var. scolymus TaxID=59895 RepID=A0A103XLM7_CYNCS|nr:WD40 repeat-containing protein [Cynara cardunculus var. scolymus]
MDKKKVVVPLVCHGHSRPVVDVFYSPITPDGIFLISASKDSTPMLRNGETGDWIGTFEGHKGAVWSCCLDTNALRAASASADFSAKLWDALTGDELHSFDHKHIVRACAFSEIKVFANHAPSGKQLLEVDVWLWDVRTGKIVRTLETKSPVTSAEVSKDGRYITTTDGSTVKFWDANHFGLVKSYDMPCNMESASLEPKFGNKFIAGGEDMWVRLFDFSTGCNKGHHGPVHCVRFSPEGDSYVSGSEDGTIRIWQTGQKENVPNGSSKDEVVSKMQDLHVGSHSQGQKNRPAC